MRVTNIDTSTIEGKIEVMQRAAKGEKVVKKVVGITSWHETTNVGWNWVNLDYQIILPEPREFWFFKDSHDRRYIMGTTAPIMKWDEIIHVREVLPNEGGNK